MNSNDYAQGDGMKLVLVITADDPVSLDEGLRNALKDMQFGVQSTKQASDDYFYAFEILNRKKDTV